MRILAMAGYMGLGVLIGYAAPLLAEDSPFSGAKDLSHSATVAVSRTHQAWLSEAEAQIRAGEFAAAIERLQSLLDAEPVFLPQGSGFENSHAAAGRLLQSLPAQWLTRYDDQFGGTARATLSKALLKGNFPALRELAERYPMTAAGFETLKLSAMWHFDHGEYLPAAAAFQAVSEHPFTKTERATLGACPGASLGDGVVAVGIDVGSPAHRGDLSQPNFCREAEWTCRCSSAKFANPAAFRDAGLGTCFRMARPARRNI